jgi:hypothetical protein
MHSSVKNKVESKLKECNKKQPRDAERRQDARTGVTLRATTSNRLNTKTPL